ncbi:S26 family signal peptidase [Sphingobium subterraneum]|uniref:Conjugative transfer signal peptidase TraF n=1 Tax=Sphingobium subterraneum TaxID=627688 RepID=A0A841J3X0_9SPHN|nr:S26 family signal peptidase [Sphingobium subterraneum]MBB6125400.1 conjugative transfer signal peptidase TraF [Sphingobium subterraneum]
MSRRGAGSDLPLIAWGEELRRRKIARHRLRRKIVAVALLIGAVIGLAFFHPAPRLVLNASASAPIGLYAVSPGNIPRRGEMVIAHLPIKYRRMAASRRYIPLNVPLVKHVGAVPGDRVCALHGVITVDGKPVAIVQAFDSMHRPLPSWSGCHVLQQNELFLLSLAVPNSFDGRYFGISRSADIIGTARLIWAR